MTIEQFFVCRLIRIDTNTNFCEIGFALGNVVPIHRFSVSHRNSHYKYAYGGYWVKEKSEKKRETEKTGFLLSHFNVNHGYCTESADTRRLSFFVFGFFPCVCVCFISFCHGKNCSWYYTGAITQFNYFVEYVTIFRIYIYRIFSASVKCRSLFRIEAQQCSHSIWCDKHSEHRKQNWKKNLFHFFFVHMAIYRRKKTDMLLVEWRINRLWPGGVCVPYPTPSIISHTHTHPYQRQQERQKKWKYERSLFCDQSRRLFNFRFKSARH